jgi:peptidoglycan/LPS O-acetylase OafA/YrhL
VTETNQQTMPIHLGILDLLRGIAILGVFLFHCLGATFGMFQLPWGDVFRSLEVSKSFLAMSPLSYGYYGVAVFFAVSGYCIHRSHARAKEAGWGKFFVRRFFRIYPPYFIALLAFFFIWPVLNFGFSGDRGWQFTSHLLLIHNLDTQTLFGINPSFWTIALEVQLYAIYPLLLVVARKYGWGLALTLAGASEFAIQGGVAVGLIKGESSVPAALAFSPFAYWLSWSLGAYLADCHVHGHKPFFSRIRILPILILAILFPLTKLTYPFAFLAFSFSTCLFLNHFVEKFQKLPSDGVLGVVSKHLQTLGVISYSFYLLHQPLVNQTKTTVYSLLDGIHLHPYTIFGFALMWYPIVFALASLFYHYIEMPSNILGKNPTQKQA